MDAGIVDVRPGDLPFAMMDRIAAEMDRRAAAMFRYAEAMAARADAGGVAETAGGAMPAGIRAGWRRELFLCLDDFRQRRVQPERPDHVARRRDRACCRTAQLRQLRRRGTMPRGRSGVQPAAPVPAPAPKQPDLILTQSSAAAAPMPGWSGTSLRCADPAAWLGPRPSRPHAGDARSPMKRRQSCGAQAPASIPRAIASRRRSPPCSPTIISPTGASPGFWIGTVAAQRSRKLIAEQLRRISAFSRR